MFLRQRFAVNETLVSLLIPFVQFNKDNVNLRRIHAVLGADLDLAEMSEMSTPYTVSDDVSLLSPSSHTTQFPLLWRMTTNNLKV